MSQAESGFVLIRRPDGDGGEFLEAWRVDGKGEPAELWSCCAVYADDEDEGAALEAASRETYYVSPVRDYKHREGFAFLCSVFGVDLIGKGSAL